MPLGQDWFEEQAVEYVVQVSDLRTEEGDYGSQIIAELKDVNPDILSPRLLFFRASKHSNSKWMRWLRGIKHIGLAVSSFDDLKGKWLHIKELREEFEIEGEVRESRFPRVVAILDSEEEAFAVFQTLPKAASTAAPAIDLETEAKLVTLYESVNGDRKNFGIVAGDAVPEGMSMDDAFAFAKSRAESKDVPF